MPDSSRGLSAFLDAWEALCLAAGAAKGRRCLRASEAFGAGTPAQREAVAVALTDLGYPAAMMSPARLGSALRRLRNLRAAYGRALGSSPEKGTTIWYVMGKRPEAVEQAAA